MNGDRIKGKWQQLSGRPKSHRGRLTDDLQVADGDNEYFAGKMHGMSRDEAAKRVMKFADRL